MVLPGRTGQWRDPAVLAHVVPFLAWIGLRLLFGRIAPEQAWPYAVQTLIGAALLAALRPWRYYPRPSWRQLPLAVGVGVLVLVVWVVPFLGLGPDLPWPQEVYLRFGVLPLGKLPSPPPTSPYDPALCGWPLTLFRLAGSAFVIAVAEEFFWRGFVYRRLIQPDFLRLPLDRFDPEAFGITVVLFGLEHREILAGMVAGAAFSVLLLRTRDIWAAIGAHVLTNLLLGLYVIRAHAYIFW